MAFGTISTPDVLLPTTQNNGISEWRDQDEKPTRVGKYQRLYDNENATKIYDYWDGENWWLCDTNGEAFSLASVMLPWRGKIGPEVPE